MSMKDKGHVRRKDKDFTVGSKRMLAYEDPQGHIVHYEQGVPVYFPGDRHPTDNPVGHVVDERKTS